MIRWKGRPRASQGIQKDALFVTGTPPVDYRSAWASSQKLRQADTRIAEPDNAWFPSPVCVDWLPAIFPVRYIMDRSGLNDSAHFGDAGLYYLHAPPAVSPGARAVAGTVSALLMPRFNAPDERRRYA